MTEHEHFDKEDFRVRTAARSYEDCLFTGCLFSSADLRDCEFTDCRFERCDLSMALLENTSMRTVRFHECKLLGTSFENCNQILFSPNVAFSTTPRSAARNSASACFADAAFGKPTSRQRT